MATSGSSPYKHAYGPMGYQQFKSYLHFRAVYPTADNGTHLNLHKNVPSSLKPKYWANASELTKNASKLLDKQRPRLQYFVGVQEMGSKEVKTISKRLAQYDPTRFPAEGRGRISLPAIDLCSRTKRHHDTEDMLRLVERLASTQSLDKDQMNILAARIDPGHTQKKMTQAQVDVLVKRLAEYDPETAPADSRGRSARKPDISELVRRSRSVSSDSINRIVERLTKFDPLKWPPNSPSKLGSEPPLLERSTSEPRYTSQEVDKITERLAAYDSAKWPPESQGVNAKAYQGKPLRFNNSKS